MTRGLANENVPGPVVRALRASGYDVSWVKEDAPGSADETVLARAQLEQRVLITLDQDFGEFAIRLRVPASSGVVLFRLRGADPEVDNARMLAVLQSRDDRAGHFSVVEDDRIRIRPLAATS